MYWLWIWIYLFGLYFRHDFLRHRLEQFLDFIPVLSWGLEKHEAIRIREFLSFLVTDLSLVF